MSIQIEIVPKLLHFKQAAGTSRGIYTTRPVWYIVLSDTDNPEKRGIGECAPLHDLSCDYTADYESILTQFANEFTEANSISWDKLIDYPSMRFGFEVAWQHYRLDSLKLWDTYFSRGEEGIPINGLIWMGSFESMRQQIEEKIEQGFRCIKLKIGAIDFDKEIELLTSIRSHFSADEIELRVDANGAFTPADAMNKLERLSKLEIHSIEQPIQPKQWAEMHRLTSSTPLPIALDEELIGVNLLEDKIKVLDAIKPQYIILKPSLHGGLAGCKEWIDLAEARNIEWWATSALESNIGLNAIAQWTATFNPTLPQGLGTGALFTDNIELPIAVKGDAIWFSPQDEKRIELD